MVHSLFNLETNTISKTNKGINQITTKMTLYLLLSICKVPHLIKEIKTNKIYFLTIIIIVVALVITLIIINKIPLQTLLAHKHLKMCLFISMLKQFKLRIVVNMAHKVLS